MTSTKMIRKYCLDDCCLGQTTEVRACPVLKCSLWYKRLGYSKTCQRGKSDPFLNKDNFRKLKPNISATEAIKQVSKMQPNSKTNAI